MATGLNFIKIYDEESKGVERFVFFEGAEQYHQGDYVRIFYHPRGAMAVMIKRMTVLEYKTNTQNLGYISH